MLNLDFIVQITMGFIGVAMVGTLWRLVKGPTIVDRVIAMDKLFVYSIGLILCLGMADHTPFYYEAALLIATLGFISTTAMCKYLLRGDIIE